MRDTFTLIRLLHPYVVDPRLGRHIPTHPQTYTLPLSIHPTLWIAESGRWGEACSYPYPYSIPYIWRFAYLSELADSARILRHLIIPRPVQSPQGYSFPTIFLQFFILPR